MKASTFVTTFKYIGTLLRQFVPKSWHAQSIEDIYNHVALKPDVHTSGQPTEAQMALIKSEGFTTVINLAPHGGENSLPDEAATLAELGLTYVHIPVDFANPTDDDFGQFVEAFEGHQSEKVWVHCAANMRVSAFMFRYRTEIEQMSREEAEQSMHRIWEPFGVWRKFIGETEA